MVHAPALPPPNQRVWVYQRADTRPDALFAVAVDVIRIMHDRHLWPITGAALAKCAGNEVVWEGRPFIHE